MYLSLLNPEEKNLFLELAVTIAAADGDFSSDEKIMVQAYCNEMQISYDEEIKPHALDELLFALQEKSSERTKKIIVFELIGLAMSDKKYDESEKDIILKLQKEFNLTQNFTEQCEQIILDYISFQEKLNALILA